MNLIVKKAKMEYGEVVSDPEFVKLDSLAKEDLTKKLEHLLAFILQQNGSILSLEEKVKKMEADMITMKLAFADSAIKNYKERGPVTQPAIPVIVKPSYAATVRGPACPVLIADYAEGAKPADRVSLAAVDQMLGAGQYGPVPQRVGRTTGSTSLCKTLQIISGPRTS